MAKYGVIVGLSFVGEDIEEAQVPIMIDAMTDQEVIAWKMDEMNSRITSLQTQQMFNNINLNNSINQQNLYNSNNFITTCPWWDIC